MAGQAEFVKAKRPRNRALTILGDTASRRDAPVAESIDHVRQQLSERIAELNKRAARLSPLDIHAQMDAIREVAAVNGLAALEGLAHCTSQLALLPGHRVAMQCCMEHMGEALESQSSADCAKILAALAARLH